MPLDVNKLLTLAHLHMNREKKRNVKFPLELKTSKPSSHVSNVQYHPYMTHETVLKPSEISVRKGLPY